MNVILENVAALAWLALAVVVAVRLRRWDREFLALWGELKAEHEAKKLRPRNCLYCMNSMLVDADGTEALVCLSCKGYEGILRRAETLCENYEEMK